MERIMNIAGKYNMVVIKDATEFLGMVCLEEK